MAERVTFARNALFIFYNLQLTAVTNVVHCGGTIATS